MIFFMMHALFGSSSVERILLFLFVNGKCYGSQLQRQLGVALTPLQKALARLEDGGIITSHYEGKTRLYQFNPAYPLLEELELLLKKAHTLLPTSSKRIFFAAQEMVSEGESPEQELSALWEKLTAVLRVSFHARSKGVSTWDSRGKGDVAIKRSAHNQLIFYEKGKWQGKGLEFTNVFRWTHDKVANLLTLEHLRFGEDSPMLLFHLAPAGKRRFVSVDPDASAGESSFGQLLFDQKGVRLSWRAISSTKNEEIDYFYS